MDTWGWIESLADDLREAGHHRLVDLIYAIPHHVHEDQPNLVEAKLPEALAAARGR